MSLIARCPACATLFRVVPDQLKISDGWVRCGQCSEVFDAMVNMRVAGIAPTPVAVSEPEAAPEPIPAPLPEPEPEAEADRAALDVAPEPLAPDLRVDPLPGDPVLESGPLVVDPPPTPGDAPRETPESQTSADVSPDHAVNTTADTPPDINADNSHDTTPGPEPEPEPALRDIAFVRQAQRRAFWQSRRMRVTLGVLAGVLGLTLCLQVVFHHRDRIASQAPALRPLLTALCASFQCRLGPPRRIESIAIESSAFTRVRADAFRLSLTLSNQADIALAMPALELTLTDVQDQPVLRRVLQPSDLGPQTPQVIEARAEWTSTLTLAIAPQANPARIVGYRVLAFYP